jgi:hypothetical protein
MSDSLYIWQHESPRPLTALFTFGKQSSYARKIKGEFIFYANSGTVPQDRHKSPQEHHKMVQLHVHSDGCTALSGPFCPTAPQG